MTNILINFIFTYQYLSFFHYVWFLLFVMYHLVFVLLLQLCFGELLYVFTFKWFSIFVQLMTSFLLFLILKHYFDFFVFNIVRVFSVVSCDSIRTTYKKWHKSLNLISLQSFRLDSPITVASHLKSSSLNGSSGDQFLPYFAH